MELAADSSEERQPYDPLPFRLRRAGKYPDIEDALEGVLSVAGHEKYRETFVKIVAGLGPFMTDESTKDDAREYSETCNKIRKDVISRVSGWDYSKIGPDELVAWSGTSNRRLWYLEPIPVAPDRYMPLLPEATLGNNRLIVTMGFLLGSRQPYQDWVRLWTEIEFGKGCSAEIGKRVQKRTVADFYISLICGSPTERAAAYENLLERAIWGAGSLTIHPDTQQDWEEKAGIADWVITTDAKKAEGMFSNSTRRILRDILRGDFEAIGTKFKGALIDALRKAKAKKRIPEDLLASLEGMMEETGPEVGRLDKALRKSEVKARIDSHAQEIIVACGARAPEVMKCLLDEPSLTNRVIAEQIGVTERHVYNIKSQLKANPDLMRRICFGR